MYPYCKVNEDTKVFQEGEMGKNPVTGGNLSTYKELCSLATDMGQPDLVYKATIWNKSYGQCGVWGAGGGFSFLQYNKKQRLKVGGVIKSMNFIIYVCTSIWFGYKKTFNRAGRNANLVILNFLFKVYFLIKTNHNDNKKTLSVVHRHKIHIKLNSRIKNYFNLAIVHAPGKLQCHLELEERGRLRVLHDRRQGGRPAWGASTKDHTKAV